MTLKPPVNKERNQLPYRRGLRSFGVLALGASAALGLAACGSSGSASGSNRSTTTLTTALKSSHSSSASKYARQLCAEVSSSTKAFGKLNLSSPSSATSAESTLSKDFNRLQSALHKVENSGQKNPGPVSTMVKDAKAGVRDMNNAFTQFGKGNLGNAKNDFKSGLKELKTAKKDGMKANLKACA